MSKVFADITTSLDGFVAGPDPTLEEPLGVGGEALHEWAVGTASFQERHGRDGGERNADSDLLDAAFERTGASVMGRKMFSGGEGPWEDDPNANGWWGDEPPFRAPVFVVTHHAREPLHLGETSFTFVTDGFESAVAQAREAAGDRDVAVSGGASVIQQAIRAGVLDELQVHVAPLLLGGGTRLFEGLDPSTRFELLGAVDSPRATHLRYRVVRR